MRFNINTFPVHEAWKLYEEFKEGKEEKEEEGEDEQPDYSIKHSNLNKHGYSKILNSYWVSKV